MWQIQQLKISDPAYPLYLKEIASPPKSLYYLGDLLPLLSLPRLSVVGTRKVTLYGRSITQSLVSSVAAEGIVIISGLALGVDGIAHHATLDARGKTIAVMPCGLDRIYPSTHRMLAAKILQNGGALVSEYAEGMPPLRQNFIARNRIVSALGDGILITEAAAKSGTLHTTSFALEQGKTVMAVPGNITSELSGGTNNLIKAGALPVTGPEDIFAALNLDLRRPEREYVARNEEEATLLRLLQQGISDTSELLTASTLETSSFNQTLTMLELAGTIRPVGGGQWALI